MNTSIKKVLCLSLILSLSAPISAAADSIFNKLTGKVIASTLISATVLYGYCQYTPETASFDQYNDTSDPACSVTDTSNSSSNILNIDIPLGSEIDPDQISFEELQHLKKPTGQYNIMTELTYLYKNIEVARIVYGPDIWRKGYAKIEHFLVREEFRGRGFGGKILQLVIAELKTAERTHVTLKAIPIRATSAEYSSALTKLENFYEKNGFKGWNYDSRRVLMEACLL